MPLVCHNNANAMQCICGIVGLLQVVTHNVIILGVEAPITQVLVHC